MALEHHKINYIEFGGRDLPRLKEFYGRVFSWTFQEYGPDYLAFNDGSLDGGFDKNGPIGKGALVILYSNDLEETLEGVRQAGGEILQEIYDFPGGRRFHFADPDGNELAVWSN